MMLLDDWPASAAREARAKTASGLNHAWHHAVLKQFPSVNINVAHDCLIPDRGNEGDAICRNDISGLDYNL